MPASLHPFVDIDQNSSARERILAVAFAEMHEHGFQGLRIDRVLEKTGLTKGALYHHFPSKKAMGYAIVDEVLQIWVNRVLNSMDGGQDVITNIQTTLRHNFSAMTQEELSKGCPVNNLVQEMSGLDEGFQERLNNIFLTWKEFTENALSHGQAEGSVRKDIDRQAASIFIVSTIQGLKGMGKCAQHCDEFELMPIVEELCNYMETLRT